VKDSGADAVYYGGLYPAAGPLNAQLKQTGADIPFAGGDGIHSPEFIGLGGDASEGALTTSVPVVEELNSAKRFVKNYKKAGYSTDYGAYGGYSYDAAWALVHAVEKAVETNNGTLPRNARAKVVDSLQHVSFDGATGLVAFDEYGDPTNEHLTMYEVREGKWTRLEGDGSTG
jgi:branched-chain amino acid transport system substrate-binding protein